jgi:putative aldouronate transport system substrate-binding protein
MRVLSGLKPIPYNPGDLTNGNNYFGQTWRDKVQPYTTDPFPAFLYLSPQDTARRSDLATVLDNYVRSESAKFITGANPLSNIDKYYSDLNALGFKEYQDFSVKAYNSYLQNSK